MKQFILLMVLPFFISCEGNRNVEVGNKTTMEVEQVYDAGNVLKGEVITAKFTLKNSGKYPLWISEVNGSCSCTVAEYPEEPIQPGDSGDVLAYVDTKEIGAGSLNKGVRVVANTDPSTTQLVVRANVSFDKNMRIMDRSAYKDSMKEYRKNKKDSRKKRRKNKREQK